MDSIVIISNIRLNDRPPYTCLICDQDNLADIYQLRKHYYYSQHLNTSTTNFVEYNANTCTNNNYLSSLESQEEVKDIPHENNNIRPKRMGKGKGEFECPLCKKYFAQKSSRARHIRDQHENPRRYACTQCELRFCSKFNLQTHRRRAHSAKIGTSCSAFKCFYCPCAYSTKVALTRHKNCQHKCEMESKGLPIEKGSFKAEEHDPQILAESVLKELKMFQKAIEVIESPQCAVNSSQPMDQITAIDDAFVEEVTIKDRLFPFETTIEYKVQRIKRVDGFRYYICEFCSKEFRKSYAYLRHRRIHTKLRPFICVICKKSFPTKSQLKRHCSSVHSEMKRSRFKCPKCLESFDTIALYDEHLRTHLPNSLITFNCKKCSKKFQSLKLYFAHKHKVIDPESDMIKPLLPSPICLVKNYETGQEYKYPETILEFQCSICHLALSSLVCLKQHEKRHQRLWKYQCNICKRYYASKSSLKVHTRLHLNVRSIKCTMCNKMFHTKYAVDRHYFIRHVSSLNNEFYKKASVHKQFCCSHMLKHMKELVKKRNEASITKDENFTSVQTIIENTDEKEVIIKELRIPNKPKRKATDRKEDNTNSNYCSFCSKAYRYKSWLKKHIAESHADERPYKCRVCLKDFRKKQILEKHLLTHQENRAKVTCQVCGKHYVSNNSLKIHLRIHTQEKPFECKLCKKFFRTSGHLKAHQRSNHQEKT